MFIFKNPTVNITLNDERLNVYLPTIQKRKDVCSHLPIQHISEVVANTVKREEK